VLMGFILSISLTIHFLIKDYFVNVKLSENHLEIIQATYRESIAWNEIKSINKIPFISPPLYRFRTKAHNKMKLFISKPSYLQSSIGTADLSDMGELIRRKKREINI